MGARSFVRTVRIKGKVALRSYATVSSNQPCFLVVVVVLLLLLGGDLALDISKGAPNMPLTDDEQWARRVRWESSEPWSLFSAVPERLGQERQDGAFGYIPAAWKALERSGALGLRIYV